MGMNLDRPPPAWRRIASWLGMLLTVAFAAHAAVWWWVSAEIERQVEATMAAPAWPGWQASGGPTRRTGYPWAAAVVIPTPAAETLRGGPGGMSLAWRAERLTVSIALIRPRTLVLDLAGQQALRIGPAPPVPFTATLLRAELPLDPDTSRRALDLAVAGLRAELPEGPLALARLDLAASIHPAARPAEPALTLAADATGIVLPPGHSWPLGPTLDRLGLDLLVTGPVPPQPDLVERAEAWRDGGGNIALRRLDVAWGEVALAGEAALALDPDLQPAGTATSRITGHPAALRALTAAGLVTPRGAMVAGAVLAPLARTPEGGGAPVVEMPFTLRDRTLSLGPIPLLRVPELVWRPPAAPATQPR